MERVSETAPASRSTVSDPATHGAMRLPYLPGLDGVRALAVAAVLAYHAGLSVWGGFLGVESFFALSGFLITALLLTEWRERGQISLGRFWMRRARRLLPALFLVLIGVGVLVAVALPEEGAGLQGDMFAALAYVMNWHLIAGQQSYFDPLVRPPLLQHLWSLAIEEQFYLLWPILFALGMRYLRRVGLLAALLIGAVASMVWMAMLYQPGADPSRVYYGTDSRASALLIGSALALVWSPWRAPATGRAAGLAFDLVGLVAVGGLLMSYVRMFEYHPLLYRGGFALVSLATAGVIVAVTHPRAVLMPRMLGAWPLRWIGLRSYGIYLWHWPIFMVTRPYLDVPLDGWRLHLLRLVAVLVLADLSFRFVELPIRRGGLRPVWQSLRTVARAPLALRRLAAAGETAAVYSSAALVATQPSQAMPAPVLVEADPPPISERKGRGQRSARHNGRRRHHHRRRAA